MKTVNQKVKNIGKLYIANSIILSAFAQLFMKRGTMVLSTLSDQIQAETFVKLLSNSLVQESLVWVTVGLFCYGISMLFWLLALAKYDLSIAYPLLSISYILVYIGAISWPVFNESISIFRLAGIVLIMIGVILVTKKIKPTNGGNAV